jgi:uncharacterized membrane protein
VNMKHPVQTSTPKDKDLVRAEIAIAYLLRYGVILCALVLAFGWGLAVTNHGSSLSDFSEVMAGKHSVVLVFPHSLREWMNSLKVFDSATWIETGLFMLILLPISRVFLAMLIFLSERNWKFVAFSFLVLAILLGSMINGKAV